MWLAQVRTQCCSRGGKSEQTKVQDEYGLWIPLMSGIRTLTVAVRGGVQSWWEPPSPPPAPPRPAPSSLPPFLLAHSRSLARSLPLSFSPRPSLSLPSPFLFSFYHPPSPPILTPSPNPPLSPPSHFPPLAPSAAHGRRCLPRRRPGPLGDGPLGDGGAAVCASVRL